MARSGSRATFAKWGRCGAVVGLASSLGAAVRYVFDLRAATVHGDASVEPTMAKCAPGCPVSPAPAPCLRTVAARGRRCVCALIVRF